MVAQEPAFAPGQTVFEAVADGLLGRVPRVDLSPFATLRA